MAEITLTSSNTLYTGIQTKIPVYKESENDNLIIINTTLKNCEFIKKETLDNENYYMYFMPYDFPEEGVSFLNLAISFQKNDKFLYSQNLEEMDNKLYPYISMIESEIFKSSHKPYFSSRSYNPYKSSLLTIVIIENYNHPKKETVKAQEGLYLIFSGRAKNIMSEFDQVFIFNNQNDNKLQIKQVVNNSTVDCASIKILDPQNINTWIYASCPLTEGYSYTVSDNTCYYTYNNINQYLPTYISIVSNYFTTNLSFIKSPVAYLRAGLFTEETYLCKSPNMRLVLWACVPNTYLPNLSLFGTVEEEFGIENGVLISRTMSVPEARDETSSSTHEEYEYSIVINNLCSSLSLPKTSSVDAIYITQNKPNSLEELFTNGYFMKINLFEAGNDHIEISNSNLPNHGAGTYYLNMIETEYSYNEIYNNISYEGNMPVDNSLINKYYIFSNSLSIENYGQQTVCLYKNTLITLADGSQKEIQYLDIDNDLLMGENFQPIKIKKLDNTKRNKEKTLYYFDDGTIIITTEKHRFYNIEQEFYQYLHLWNIGEHAKKIDGSTPALIKVEVEPEDCVCWGIWTEDNTCWANGLLSAETQANEEPISQKKPKKIVQILQSLTPLALRKALNL